ncbi:MAG TPA: glycosyltransferase [Pseudonocardiaceae bacterium]|nr:glycosyltransferase [Pseudonocardiaceae bacterium]
MNEEVEIAGRVCLVSHRLGGYDGVSIEAAKWDGAFQRLGWQVTRAAGFFVDRRDSDVTIKGLWADQPGSEPPPVDHDTIRRLVRTHHLLVLDNAGTLWSAPRASLAWERHALAVGIPTIVRHHDPSWQGAPLRAVTEQGMPLHDPRHLHVLINRCTYEEFAMRWPELAFADALRLAHNRVDIETLANGGDREQTRASLGVRPDEILIVHPARVEAPRKKIPRAVEFANAIASRVTPRPVRYWLTDPSPTPPPLNHAVLQAPGLIRGYAPNQADMYAACDLVVLPSSWEGWGLPVTEAAAAKRLVAAGPYPVLEEIRALGLTVYDPTDIDLVANLLENNSAATDVLYANYAVTRDHFDLRYLPDVLTDFAAHAKQLASVS